MTAEPDLLPSSVAAFTEALYGERGSLDAWLEVNDEREVRAHVEAYAHACVAELQREIEALRAEVERTNGWNERVSVCRDHVADIVDGPCVICALDAAEAHAERLAEALRLALNSHGKTLLTDPPQDAWKVNRVEEIGRALLRDQEEGQ